MEGIWGHEQGVNNTFYGSPDREIALLITVPLSQCDPKWPNTFINSLFILLRLPPVMASCILDELAGGGCGYLCHCPLLGTTGFCLSPHKGVSPKETWS